MPQVAGIPSHKVTEIHIFPSYKMADDLTVHMTTDALITTLNIFEHGARMQHHRGWQQD